VQKLIRFLEYIHCNSNDFEVQVGMHQGSALSPLLFVSVMEAVSRDSEFPYHGLVVIAETEDDLINRHSEWNDFVENRGMRVNRHESKSE